MPPTSDVFYADAVSGQNGYIFNTDSDCVGGIGPETYLDTGVLNPFIETSWDDGSPHIRRVGYSFWDTSSFVLTPGNYITEMKFDIFCSSANATFSFLAQLSGVKSDYADAEALFLGLYPATIYSSFSPSGNAWSSVVLGLTAISDFLLDTSRFALGILPDVDNSPQDANIFHSTRAVDEFNDPWNIPFLTITQDAIPAGNNGQYIIIF